MSWGDKALAAETLGMLAAARLLVKTSPGKRLISRLGEADTRKASVNHTEPAQNGRASGHRTDAERIAAMVERGARITFWRSMCLEKALAGRWMLRRRGIESTMYVGMARQGQTFVAHAWLVGEGRTLIGAGNTVYAPLAAFRNRQAQAPEARA
jgi:hypothetical protein